MSDMMIPYQTAGEIDPDKEFFCVLNPTSQRPITAFFSDYDKAMSVAEKMAAKYNDRFYVMQAVGFSEPKANVNTVRFSERIIEAKVTEK